LDADVDRFCRSC